MKRLPMPRVWFLFVLPTIAASSSPAQQLCPPMPGPITEVYRDVHSDVQAKAGAWGKITGAELRVQTDVTAKNIFNKYPSLDKLFIAQMTASMWCTAIAEDKSLDTHERQLRLTEVTERVLRFANPQYLPLPLHRVVPQVDAGKVLLEKIERFNREEPTYSNYGWTLFVADVDKLYRDAMDFYDLLGAQPPPRYADVSSVYAALDEASDELSIRARLMHDSGMVSDNYDRHIFVGPGWFRVSLQTLRRAHEQHTTPDKKYVDAFGSDMGYWKLCWSGTGENSSSCK